LYYRETGQGRPLVVLHGGPDFDHSYLLPELARLHVPTLVLHADSDFIPPEIADHIARAIPGARLVVLRNCGHFSYLECPDEFARAVTEFLNAG
jgi:pimeloyl-ACP methyl ester carboxylesterase